MPLQNGLPVDLKSLLSKWKLESILSHLLAEKVDIEIFEMMKLSHIKPLLENFPLGIQIRFEYYLEQWREEIGKPFKLSTNDDSGRFSILKDHKTKIEINNKSTQTDFASQTNNAISKDVEADLTDAKDQRNIEMISRKFPNASNSLLPVHEVDLLTILRNASCGVRLITSYGLRQSFTDKERKLLIETIVDHYIDNKIKFNVQISYALEQAVLKMFPSEKLSSYRTAKLGRIYITYVSFKAKERAKAKDQQKTDGTTTTPTTTTTNVINNTNNRMIENENFKEIFQITGDHDMMRSNSTDAVDMFDVQALNDESFISVDADSMIFAVEDSDDDAATEENKIIPEQVDIIIPSLDSGILVRKMVTQKRQRIEEMDGPFTNFTIPWEKLPHELTSLLENGQQLGRRLNIFANLIVHELRKVSTKVPMRVLRSVSQQAIMKYPRSFLDADANGILMPSTTSALLSRLRNRNTFLNRQDR